MEKRTFLRGLALCLLSIISLAANANTTDQWVDLEAEMFKSWSSPDADAVPTDETAVADDAEISCAFKLFEQVGSGTVVYGHNNIYYLWYANVTGTKTIQFEGTAGIQLRVLMNRPAPVEGGDSHGGASLEMNVTIGDDGIGTIDVSDLEYVHINAIKTGWSSPAGTLEKIQLFGTVNNGETENDPQDPSGEVLPLSYFTDCAVGGIPEGFVVYTGEEARFPGSSYTGGPRMIAFDDGGDFTRGLYFRDQHVEYGSIEGYGLHLEADTEYTIQFNTAAWKDGGYNVLFEIESPDYIDPVYSQLVTSTLNVNGSTNVVEGSTLFKETFVPPVSGNYVLKWYPADDSGNKGSWIECLLANVCVRYASTDSSFVGNETIAFVDTIVKRICIENWDTDGDGELSMEEAAAVTDLGGVFSENDFISSFDELQYFNGLTSIAGNAFYNCSLLANITIPSSVTIIGGDAFNGCSALTSIDLPSVTSIDYSAFESCSSLASIELPVATSIGDGAFYGCSSLNSVDLPSATSIGIWAFSYCDKLTSVSLPAATAIGDNAFYFSEKLTSVSLPTATTIGDRAFGYCYALTSLLLPSVIAIGEEAFFECNLLTSIELPSATLIGINAFGGCRSMTSISLPSATSIGKAAFCGCISLSSFDLSAVTKIGDNAFGNCYALTSVSLPIATSIGDDAFGYCNSLTSVSLPTATSIGDGAFRDCSSLTSIDLPSATSIGGSAFTGCTSVTSIDLPSATTIGDGAFYDCNKLTSISIPSATTIGDRAFYNCNKLTSISLPASVTSIGEYAFCECRNLDHISLPASVTSIGEYAFYECRNLDHIYSEIVVPFSISGIVFNGISSTATLHVTYGTIEAYQAAGGWTNNFNHIVDDILMDTVTAYSSPSFRVALDPNGGTAEYFNGYYRLGKGGSLTLRGKGNVISIKRVKINLQEPSRTGSDLMVSAGTLNGTTIEEVYDSILTITAQGSWPQLWAASLTVTYMGTPPDGTYAIRLPQYQTHGSVTSDMDWADEGDEVTLTATPEEGYHLARLYANRGAVTLTASATASNQYTFTMPAEDVIIGAVFAEGDVTTGVLLNVPEDGETATNATPIYNLQGQRLTRLQRGVNVVGGKKVLK